MRVSCEAPASPSRRGWALLLAAGLLATAAAAVAARHFTIQTRLVDLLPDDSPAAADYRRFLASFGGFEQVFAVVVPKPGAAVEEATLAEAAQLLAEKLAALPEIAEVRAGMTEADERFVVEEVLPRAPLLFAETGAEAEARAARALDPESVRSRVRELRRRLTGPLAMAGGRFFAADPLGLAGDLPALAGSGSFGRIDPVTGSLLAPAGGAALVLATPAVAELDSAAGRALAAGIASAEAEIAAELGTPIEVHAAGGPLYAAADEAIVKADVAGNVVASAAAILLLLVAFYRGLALPLAMLAAVAAGIVWTAGVTVVTLGEISVLGISFASILLGLGIDYGIHGATRFRERRLGGLAAGPAMRAAFRDTGPAILAATATNAAGFGVLALAHFRPVRELGLVEGVGIVATLAATIAVGAPLAVLAPRLGRAAAAEPGFAWRWSSRAVGALAALGARRPRAVLAAAAVASLAAAAGAARLTVEVDLRALRPADHPAETAERILAERFGLGLDTTTVVVSGGDLGEALAAAEGVERALSAALGPGAEVTSPARWLYSPQPAPERLAPWSGPRAAAALAAFDDEVAAQGLKPAAFARSRAVLAALARGEAPPPPPSEQWPAWLGELIRLRPDGGAEAAVRLRLPLGTWPDGPPPEVLRAIEDAAPGAAVASAPRLGAALRRLVLDDLGRLAGWGAAAVVAMVAVSFRLRLRPALLALVPISLASLWTAGLAGAFGLPVDPFAVVVLPLLMGIGIDNGLHALHEARHGGGLTAAVAKVGRPIVVTTAATCIGFGSLVTCELPALQRGGALIAVGVALCFCATLVVLPALGEVFGPPYPARSATTAPASGTPGDRLDFHRRESEEK